jgi:hypothetical protein
MTVGEYLDAGSPEIDYRADPATFIKSFLGDVDVGGMYNNYNADLSEWPSLGVRYIHTDARAVVEREEVLRFTVLNFGCRCAGYLAGQGQSRILEIIMREPDDATSAFRWCKTRLNLPCSEGHDPSLPRVLVLKKDGELAT